VTLMSRGIAMPHGTNNVTCHTQTPDTTHDIFILFFQKI